MPARAIGEKRQDRVRWRKYSCSEYEAHCKYLQHTGATAARFRGRNGLTNLFVMPKLFSYLSRHTPRAFIICAASLLVSVAHAQDEKTVKVDGVNPQLWEQAHKILADNCLMCHGATKPKAGLRLDTRAGVLEGAGTGPVVVENDPKKSTLAQVLHPGYEVQMPPKGPLKAEDVAAIEAWIQAGFPFPNEAAAAAPEKLDPQQVEFFETSIRPVLANNCYSCHGETKQMAGLRVDSKLALLKGSANGPVLVPNDPDGSKLIQVIRHIGEIKMPQGKPKLPAQDIANLEAWVKMGAPWPGGEVSAAALAAAKNGEYVITPEQRKFWSFSPSAITRRPK